MQVHLSRYTSRGHPTAIVPMLCEQTMAAVEAMFTPRLRFREFGVLLVAKSGEQGKGTLEETQPERSARVNDEGRVLVGRTTAKISKDMAILH